MSHFLIKTASVLREETLCYSSLQSQDNAKYRVAALVSFLYTMVPDKQAQNLNRLQEKIFYFLVALYILYVICRSPGLYKAWHHISSYFGI